MKLSTLFFAASLTLAASIAYGEEFGNIFGDSLLESESRLASARALEGIGLAIDALRERELSESSASELLTAAANAIDEASDLMRALLETRVPEQSIPSEFFGVIDSDLSQIARRYDFSLEGLDLRRLYALLILIGDELSESLRTASEFPADVPVLPSFADQLSNYLSVGGLVTAVSRSGGLQ